MSDRVTANTEDLQAFVSSGHQYVEALRSMHGDLEATLANTRATLAGLGATPVSSAPLLLELIVEAGNNNQFVSDLHDLLHEVGVPLGDTFSASVADVAAGLRSAGHQAYEGDRTLAQDLAYQDRLLTHDALDAMQRGLHPNEAGVPPEYFPPEYVSMKDLDAEIVALEADRDDADGFAWWRWDNDGERIAEIDAELSAKRTERAALADGLGASGGGYLTEVEAIAALGDHTGDQAWEGEQYGRWTNEHEELFGHNEYGSVILNYRSGRSYGDEYTRIGNELVGRPEVALAFYNEVGADGAAHLPTALADSVGLGNDGEDLDEVLEDFSVALAEASELDHPDGSPRLEFTGDELMAGPLTNNGSAWQTVYDPAFLFVSGDFDQQFLVDATAELLRQVEENPDRAPAVWLAQSEYGPSAYVPGEDSRNILLARSSEDQDLVTAVVAELDSTGDLDLLLSPEVPFAFTYRGDDSYHPNLASDAPIATFLVIAGSDDLTANTIMNAAFDDPDPFSDSLVAAGIDGIMAQHATLMYDPSVLQAVGIEQTSINDHTPPGRAIDAEAWRTVHGKVFAHGQGEALTAATFGLVDEAIGGSLDTGEFDATLVDPFATMAGSMRAETSEAHFAYFAELDEETRRRNQRLNTAVNIGFDLVGSLPHPVFAIGAPIGSALYTYFDPLAASTDQELEAYRDQYTQLQVAGQDVGNRWQTYVYHRCLAAAMEINETTGEPYGATVALPSGEQASVPITYEDGEYFWVHPVTGSPEEVPSVNNGEYRQLFPIDTPIGSAVTQNNQIHYFYMNGVLVAADDRENVIRRRAEAQLDGVYIDHETGEIMGNGGETRLQDAESEVAKVEVYDWVAEG